MTANAHCAVKFLSYLHSMAVTSSSMVYYLTQTTYNIKVSERKLHAV